MINSIKDLKEVNGKEIVIMDELREKFPEKFNESGQMDYKWFESEIRPNKHIYVRHDKDSLTFNMMTKPVSEGGKGCQFKDLIEVAIHMCHYLNQKFPCRQNSLTITKLQEALMWQADRDADRIKRGVEGENKL